MKIFSKEKSIFTCNHLHLPMGFLFGVNSLTYPHQFQDLTHKNLGQKQAVSFAIVVLVGTKGGEERGWGDHRCYFQCVREIPQVARVFTAGRWVKALQKQNRAHLPRFVITLQELLSVFPQYFFFSILHENSSTLSFSQELTDKNRKAQWIPVLQLSSEAKGKV